MVIKAGSVSGGVARTGATGLFGLVYQIVTFFLKFWWLALIIIVMVSVIAMAVVDSIKQKSFNPFVYEVGGRLLSADGVLYNDIQKIKDNPEITTEEKHQFTSYYDKLKFMLGKWGSHYRIFINLLFIIGMFLIFYVFLNYLDNRKLVNIIFAIILLILLQLSFTLMLIYKNKLGNYPSLQQFLVTYTSVFYIAFFVIATIIVFALFTALDVSKTLINIFYATIFAMFLFIFIGYYGTAMSTSDTTHSIIVKELRPFRGVIELVKNWKVVVGKTAEGLEDKLPNVDENILQLINNNSVVI